MKCGHCDEKIEKTEPAKVCPYREQNPTDHTHAVCLRCLQRMTAEVPCEVQNCGRVFGDCPHGSVRR